MDSRWIGGTGNTGTANAPERLFCFPHAGGGPAFFRPWCREFAPDVVWGSPMEQLAAAVKIRSGLLGGVGGAIHVVAESSIDRIADLVSANVPGPALLVIDSVQTATIDDLDGPAGSVGQVRGAALRLMELAKPAGIAVVLVGHVTKDGSIAGPKTLEHLVDAVLTLEGERLAQWGDPSFRSCHSIWGDSRGDLYVVRPGAWGRPRRVVKYRRRG